MNISSIQKTILSLAVVVYIITAINSKGYYHADEQYQIIEFAGIKLGTHTPHDLAWEYTSSIRSATMPTICYGLFSVFNLLHLTDPYTQTALLRIVMALLSLLAIHLFVRSSSSSILPPYRTVYLLLSFFLWFIPFLNVRFSSESLSGISFLLAIALFQFQKEKKYQFIFVGALLGFSFLCRFQSGFLSLGFLAWMVLINETELKKLIQLLAALAAMVLLGIAIDTWFYQKLVCSFYNYWSLFSTTDDAASSFGILPWYYYIWYLIKLPFFPIGVLIVSSIVVIIVRQPKSLVVWIVVPFIIIHSIIHHKEERFLFPIINFLPLILVMAYQEMKSIFSHPSLHYPKLFLALPLVLINITGLIAMGTKAAGVGRIDITHYIHQHYQDKEVNLISCQWSSPYNPWQSLPTKYYQEKNVHDIQIKSLCSFNDSLVDNNKVNLLVLRKAEKSNSECAKWIDKNHLVMLRQSVPEWMEKVNGYYKGLENDDILELYLINL